MSTLLKSEVPSCLEYDFVETDGSLKELTVTITLAEYRYLIRTVCEDLNTINRLNEQISMLTSQTQALRNVVLANHPELLDDITRIWNDLKLCIDSNEESQEEDEKTE